MSFFDKIFGRSNTDSRLEGIWISDIIHETVERTTMTFTKDGKLIYDIWNGEKIQRILMTYRTDGNIIYSNQPSHPKEEKTKYNFTDLNTLILDFEGEISKFKRQIV